MSFVNEVVTDVEEIRQLVAKVNRMLYLEDQLSYSGHVSMRHPETDIVYLNPFDTPRGAMMPDDVVAIDLENQPQNSDTSQPVGEAEIHTAVYRAREEITACLHTHPQYLTLYSITGTDIQPVSQRGSVLAEGQIPILDRPGKITQPEHSKLMIAEMGDSNQLLIRNHGAVVCDQTIFRAFARAIYLDKNAEWQHRSSNLGTPNPMSQSEVERLYQENWTTGSIEKFWRYFEWKARENGHLSEDL